MSWRSAFARGDQVEHVSKPGFRGVVVATIAKVPGGQATEPIWQVWVRFTKPFEGRSEAWAWEHLLQATQHGDRLELGKCKS